ncbi:MAG: sporulation integral membrane protein YlbJ [Bacillota bacterium]|jgi:sporulation integral membrane protein YlbJ
MKIQFAAKKSLISDLLIVLAASVFVFLVLIMIFNPAEILAASTEGLLLWFQIVLPSILPFLIASELMMGLGVVHFLGKLLEPLMRPIFNIPGPGAFVAAMGYTSGFPVGAILTGRLRREGLCTRIEAERLISFTNNASPLFMLVAIPVGMFGLPSIGMSLAAIHYGTNLIIGWAMRFYCRRDPERKSFSPQTNSRTSPWRALIEARHQDGRPIGQLLGDAVRQAMSNLLTIGGFIIFFSVLMKILSLLGVLNWLAALITRLFPGIDSLMCHSLAIGFWEITLGTKSASQLPLSLETRLTLVSAILGWSGLAIHAQIASFIADTDIRLGPFIVARLTHAVLSSLIFIGAFRWEILKLSEPAWSTVITEHLSFSVAIWHSGKFLLYSLGILLIVGLITTITNQSARSLHRLKFKS